MSLLNYISSLFSRVTGTFQIMILLCGVLADHLIYAVYNCNKSALFQPLSHYEEYWIIPAKDRPLCKATQNICHSFGIELLLTVLWVPFFNYTSQDC